MASSSHMSHRVFPVFLLVQPCRTALPEKYMHGDFNSRRSETFTFEGFRAP